MCNTQGPQPCRGTGEIDKRPKNVRRHVFGTGQELCCKLPAVVLDTIMINGFSSTAAITKDDNDKDTVPNGNHDKGLPGRQPRWSLCANGMPQSSARVTQLWLGDIN